MAPSASERIQSPENTPSSASERPDDILDESAVEIAVGAAAGGPAGEIPLEDPGKK